MADNEYDVSQATYRTAAPTHVDSNGVPIAVPTTLQIGSPNTSFVEIVEGSTTQICEPFSSPRVIKVKNVGNVPVYITASPDIIIRRTTSVSFTRWGLPQGTPVHCGESEDFVTASGLYATLRKTGDVFGTIPTFFKQSGLVAVTV